MLNTILYNRKEETNDEVSKRKGNIPTATPSAAIAPGPSISNDVSAVSSSSDALFDRKIDLITGGIDGFFASKIRGLPKDNALTIVDYIFR